MLFKIRSVVTNPIVEWEKAILNLATAVVAVLVLVMNLPILPPSVVGILVSIVAALNTVIEFLKLLIPAQPAQTQKA